MITTKQKDLHIHRCWAPATQSADHPYTVDYVLKSDYGDAIERIAQLEAALRDQDFQWLGIKACTDNKCTACVNVATMQRRKIADALGSSVETEEKHAG